MEDISTKLLEQLQWRYATKRFDSTKKISAEDWHVLSEVLRLSPSSYGLQPWKFIIPQKPELRTALRAVSWNQSQVEECSHLVVFATLKKVTEEYIARYIDKIAEVRAVSKDDLVQYRQMMIGDIVHGPRAATSLFWAQRQAYIALGTLLEAAALKNIDACPMEGFSSEEYDKILGLEGTEYGSVAVAALGYRSTDDHYQQLPKVRFDRSEVIQMIE